MNWKVFHSQNPDKSGAKKETFGFNTSKPAPKAKELNEFKDGMLNILKNAVTTNKTNDFQEKLKQDCKKMKQNDKVFVAADKTTNFYKVTVDDYNKLLEIMNSDPFFNNIFRRCSF